MIRLFFSLFVIFCCSQSVNAQLSPWKLDFYLGVAGYAGDIADHPFHSQNLRPAVGLGGQYQISAPFSLKTDLYHGNLSGDDSYFTTNDWPTGDRSARFTTSFTQWNLSLEYHFLESPRLGRLRKWSPYLAVGAGLVFYDPKPNYGHTRNPELEQAFAKDHLTGYSTVTSNFLLEIGLDWRLFNRWSVGMSLGAYPTASDYLDGVSWAGNPDQRDWFGRAGIRLQYQFVPKPDTDGDGIADESDKCPEMPGLLAMQGCPDADQDGIHDGLDLCRLVPGKPELHGCPDTDGDGIADQEDLCPADPGPFHRGGCPIEDRDGDGIEDPDDLCPDAAGPPEREGCPAIDSDMDGILDEDDRCPYEFGLIIFGGCPDTDGDGIENSRDACPTLFGVYANNGCPEVIFPEEAAAEFNKQALLFESGSSDIPRYGLLDQIASFLKENQDYSLTIRGYTDSEGNQENHQQLSRSRARTCYRYLVQQGISDDRMTYLGLGIKSPLSKEVSENIRALNRRVEFFLHR